MRVNGKRLEGVVAMLPTPMFDDPPRTVNYEALAKLMQWTISYPISGFVATPSIGEFSRLKDKERWSCWEVCMRVAQRVNPNLYKIAMISADDTYQAEEHARVALKMGFDAGQLIVPYYWGIEDDEVFAHFESVASIMPVVVYHNPALTKKYFSRKLMGMLALIPNVVAIKEVKTDSHVELEPLFDRVCGGVPIFTTYRAAALGCMLESAGIFANVQTVPFCLKLLQLFREETIPSWRRMWQLQRMMNRVFPRGGEDNPRHIGFNKMSATLVTGIDIGPPRRSHRLPDQKDWDKMLKVLPEIWKMIRD